MSSKLQQPKLTELSPRITVIGVGGAGGNAINNMIASGIDGVEFIAANTDAQALVSSSAERRIQLGANLTEGLGAGARPEIGEEAAKEAIEEIRTAVEGSHMVFIAAGMGGGTGTGAAAVVAKVSRDLGILTVAIVTKPFNFEGNKRLRTAQAGIENLRHEVDTLIVIPNQNLFRIANERTTFAEAFLLADQVLHSGIACITDLIVREGLINLDFADVRAVMSGMGTAMMGTGEAAGERRAIEAAELAILNPLLDDVSLRGAKGLLVSISGSRSLTLYEVDEAASRVREEVDPDANIIIGATFDESLGDKVRVSIVASGLLGAVAVAPVRASKAAATTAWPQAPRGLEPTPQLNSTAPSRVWGDEHKGPGQRAQAGFQQANDEMGGEASEPFAEDYFPEAEQAGDPQPQSVWNGPNDVVIELGAPPMPQGGPFRPSERHEFDPSGQAAPAFRPQAPIDGRRPARRLPEVEDFPQFAQKAYRSKRGEPAPQPAPTPAVAERKRGGLFTFLTGRKETPAKSGESMSETRPVGRELSGTELGGQAPDAGQKTGPQGDPGDNQPRHLPMPRHRPRQA